MNHLLRLFLLSAAAALCATNASATDSKSGYLILGPGAYTCERIISDLARDAKDKNPASMLVYSYWLAGNLTSYNRDTKGTYSILGTTTFEEAFAWTLQFCEENPSKIYSAAVDSLILKLKPHRQSSMPARKKEKEDKDDQDDDDDDGDMHD